MKTKKRRVGRPREPMAAKPIARKVMALKAKGLSFSKIGAKLGFTKTRAQQIHSRVLAEQSGS